MRARRMSLILVASMAASPLVFGQDHAVPRGGGGGGGSSPGGSGGHPTVSSSGGGSSSSGSSSSGSGYSGGSSHSPSRAESRHPRAGTGRGGGGGGYYPPGGGYYPCYGCGSGWYYPGYWGSYWWPYGSYGWYGGYWGYPGYGYGGGVVYHRSSDYGSLRVLVDPAEARVYVDGYYAGTVDDFDGLFQRLNLSAGRHEITLKLEGYKTHRMRVWVPVDGTLKLHHDMEQGSGETFADLAGGAPPAEDRRERDVEEPRAEPERPQARDEGDGGQLRLDVRPADASIYVDGAFRGTARDVTALRLPPGRHRVEIVRPGYRTEERELEVRAGEATELVVELERGAI